MTILLHNNIGLIDKMIEEIFNHAFQKYLIF